MQDFVFAFVELCELPVRPFLQAVKVPLNSSDCSPQLGITCTLVENAVCSVSQVINDVIKHCCPSTASWGTPVASGHHTTDFVSLITTCWTQCYSQFSTHLIIHFSTPYLASLVIRRLQDIVAKLAKVKVYNTRCPPLVHNIIVEKKLGWSGMVCPW